MRGSNSLVRYSHLEGLSLVGEDTSTLQGQLVYLDFDGDDGVTYDGPIQIEELNIAAFTAPGELAGSEPQIMETVAASLNALFARAGVTFTAVEPADVSDYSTVYVGGDDSTFSRYGSFAGLAENVDHGNTDRHDQAFVFAGCALMTGQDQETYLAKLTNLIAHESGHLLGMSMPTHIAIRSMPAGCWMSMH